jgi:hypothetical protein
MFEGLKNQWSYRSFAVKGSKLSLMATCGYIIPEVDVKRLVVENREGTDVYLSS